MQFQISISLSNKVLGCGTENALIMANSQVYYTYNDRTIVEGIAFDLPNHFIFTLANQSGSYSSQDEAIIVNYKKGIDSIFFYLLIFPGAKLT